MKNLFYALVAFSTLFVSADLWGQAPIGYWRFECDGDRNADYSNDPLDLPMTLIGSQNFQSGGPVGDYVRRAGAGDQFFVPANSAGQWPREANPNGFTVEFLERFDPNFSAGELVHHVDRFFMMFSSTAITIRYWTTGHTQETFVVYLNGIDRFTSSYYRDNEWHHFALRYDADPNNPSLTLYVDGVTDPLMTHTPLGQIEHSGLREFRVGSQLSTGWSMDLDEVMVYDEAIPGNLILEHYCSFVNGEPYNDNACNGTNVNPPGTTQQRDPSDYPIGYDINNPPANGTDLLPITPIEDQYSQNYQLPRFKDGHSLPVNHPWLGSTNQYTLPNWVSNSDVVDMFSELADDWNYSFTLGILEEQTQTNRNNSGHISSALANAAQANPQWERSIVTNWGRAQTMFDPNANKVVASIYASNHPDSYYYRDVTTSSLINRHPWGIEMIDGGNCPSGNSIDLSEAPVPATQDGNTYGGLLDDLETDIGVSVEMIMENGEEGPWHLNNTLIDQLMGNSPITSEIGSTCSGVSPMSPVTYSDQSFVNARNNYAPPFNCNDIDQCFLASRKTIWRNAYRDAMINSTQTPGDHSFWWYDISGGSPWDFQEMIFANQNSAALSANSSQLGMKTPYLYPQNALRWYVGNGPAKGWVSLALDLTKERLVSGNNFIFSAPAVSPGLSDGSFYAISDIAMMRPGQYLGLLKATSMIGAEFFVATNINSNDPGNGNFHSPRLNTWQFAVPAYAQAVVSREQDFFYNSDIMEGNLGTYSTNTFIGNGGGYRFWGGANNYLITARVGNTGSAFEDHYMISGSIQNLLASNFYNYDGNTRYAPSDEKRQTDVMVPFLPNQPDLQFPIVQHGNTYYYINQTRPVFYQLDAWHESSHPDHWSNQLFVEAEVYDYAIGSTGGGASLEIATDGLDDQPILDGDFRAFTSYMGASATGAQNWPANAELGYRFEPRNIKVPETRFLMVRVRNTNGNAQTLKANIEDENGNLVWNYSQSIEGECWHWVKMGTATLGSNADLKPYLLRMMPQGPEIDIDQWAFVDGSMQADLLAQFNGGPTVATVSSTNSCPGNDATITVELTGYSPFRLEYTDGNNDFVINDIEPDASGQYTFSVPANNQGITYTLTQVSDYNCATGTISNASQTVNETVLVAPSVSATNLVLCALGDVSTLSVSGTWTSILWSNGMTGNNISVSDPGTYSAVVTSGNCSVSTGCITISTALNVTVGIQNGNLPICVGADVTLIASGNGTTFTWRDPNGVIVGNNNTLLITRNDPMGIYSVTMGDTPNSLCEDVTTIQVASAVELEIDPVPALCTTDPVVQLTTTFQGGTWNTPTNGIFDPGAQTLPGPSTASYTEFGGYGCPVQTATRDIAVFDCSDHCQASDCGYFGSNLVQQADFPVPSDCNYNSTTFPFDDFVATTHECVYANLNNGEFIVTNIGGDHTGTPGSNFLYGLTESSWTGPRSVWNQGIELEANQSYVFRFWARSTSAKAPDFTILIENGSFPDFSGSLTSNWQLFCFEITPITSGIFYFNIKMNNGHPSGGSNFQIDDVTLLPIGPDFGLVGPVSAIAAGQQFTLSVSPGCSGCSYEWYEVNNWAAGVLSSNATLSIAGLGANQSATYECRATGSNNNCSTYRYYTVTSTNKQAGVPGDDLQVEETLLSDEVRMEVFPNPSSGLFTLRGVHEGASWLRIGLYDAQGKFILENKVDEPFTEFRESIDLTNYASGVYFLRVYSDDYSRMFRLVKN